MRTLKFQGVLGCFCGSRNTLTRRPPDGQYKTTCGSWHPLLSRLPMMNCIQNGQIATANQFSGGQNCFGGSCGNFGLPAVPSTDTWQWCSTASSGKLHRRIGCFLAKSWEIPLQTVCLSNGRSHVVCKFSQCEGSSLQWFFTQFSGAIPETLMNNLKGNSRRASWGTKW